jgi:ribonuclease Z
MKKLVAVSILLLGAGWYGGDSQLLGTGAPLQSSTALSTSTETSDLKVILLGTGAGPPPNARRFGISTLVVAGTEKLMFDCGRAATIRMSQLGIWIGDVTKLFVTHLHSDHVVGIPDLYLAGWTGRGRKGPFQVWGPAGTRSMMEHIEKAFAFDIHVRRDLDERLSSQGIQVRAIDIEQGVVHEANGVKVTAFLVDHGPVKPVFGYRVDYKGRSVVLSGDTEPSDNLVRFSRGVDVLIHEVGRFKQDPELSGPPDDVLPDGRTRRQAQAAAAHHTDGAEAGQIFSQVKPRLAVFSHGGTPDTIPLVKRSYSGPVEVGEDMMTINVGEKIEIRRFKSDNR